MNPAVLYKISYGMYVIGSGKGEKLNGQIANTVFQVTSDPATIAVSINKKNLTHALIEANKTFTISILSVDASLKNIGHFGFKSGREINKLEGVKYKVGKTGAPVFMDDALGYVELELISQVDQGTHTVFIGKVVEGEVLSGAEPMTYAYYHAVKKGTAPATAPTYLKPESQEISSLTMPKYVCKVCNYIYDPKKGDPETGVAAGTSFKDLPADWVCPVCGAGKDQFEEVKG